MVIALIASAWSQPVSASTPLSQAKYVFRIPVFPGTELLKSSPVLADLNKPFATTLAVYSTKNERSLSKDAVIAFYRDSLASKGWGNGIFQGQKSEPYLSMRTQVFENLEDGTRIQVAGEFYLWVSPKDGMITAYLKQWRISSTDQATQDSRQTMVERLTNAATKAGYTASEIASDNGWKNDFENEYLVDRTLYGLEPNEVGSRKGTGLRMDAPPGTLTVALLTYRDAKVAMAESALHEKDYQSLTRPHSVGVKGKVVVTIEGDAPDAKLASLLAETLPQ